MKQLAHLSLILIYLNSCQSVTAVDQLCDCDDTKGTAFTKEFVVSQRNGSWYLNENVGLSTTGSIMIQRYQPCEAFPESLKKEGLIVKADVLVKNTCPNVKTNLGRLTLKRVRSTREGK